MVPLKKLHQVLEQSEYPQLPKCDNVEVGSISREEIVDRAWLAGIIDGEGTIILGNPMTGRMTVQVRVENTDPYMIQRISQIWERHNIKFSLGFQRRPPKRDTLAINSTGYGSVKKALELVLPYLTTKYKQAVCLLRFIDYRQSFDYNTNLKDSGIAEIAVKVREELHALRYQDHNLQRLKRVASKSLNLD